MVERSKHLYTLNTNGIKEAENLLIMGNSAVLINYLYLHREDFPDPAVRAGLAVKILLRSRGQTFSQELLGPVIEDLLGLLSNSEYLDQFGEERELRKNAISQEVSLVNKCLKLDDTISLNTLSRQVPSFFEQDHISSIENQQQNTNTDEANCEKDDEKDDGDNNDDDDYVINDDNDDNADNDDNNEQ